MTPLGESVTVNNDTETKPAVKKRRRIGFHADSRKEGRNMKDSKIDFPRAAFPLEEYQRKLKWLAAAVESFMKEAAMLAAEVSDLTDPGAINRCNDSQSY